MTVAPLVGYISQAPRQELPQRVVEQAVDHILDSLAAAVSGSRLPAGLAARRFAQRSPGRPEALVVGTPLVTDAPLAALANGMSAHADETDDSHEPSLTHPGCVIVPAALAVADRSRKSGLDLIRAVTLGYDVAGRMTRALWPEHQVLRTTGHSTHAMGGLFGAAAACAALAELPAEEIRYLLSYAAQQAAGLKSWLRDVEHIEKAFVFGGMGASNAVRALTFVECGWPAVRDVFAGPYNLFETFGTDPDQTTLHAGLGERFAISETTIKRFPVGSPVQAPLQGLIDTVRELALDLEEIERVDVTMATGIVGIVADRHMPNISLEYLLAAALADGDLDFAAAHDQARFERWRAGDRDPRIRVHKDDEMAYTRQAIVAITMRDGTVHRRHETAVLGSPAAPMSAAQVDNKCLDLCRPVLGDEQAYRLVTTVRSLAALPDCRTLRPLLSTPVGEADG